VKRLLNAEELAERLGLKISTVYALTSGRTLNADIPPWFYVGRYPRWSEDDIEQWLAEKERHYAASKVTNSEGGTRRST
jgi:predicted DNA-binding transcriptional regulator AlpA